MPDEETLLDKLNGANDKYHKALEKIFLDKDLAVEVKTKVGKVAENVFRQMIEIKTILEAYY